MRHHSRKGFTLIELLVVVVIVLLCSAVVLPTVLPALNNRQVSESARILQAALMGARDAAIRNNAPRGIRLLPDPLLTTLSFADASKAGVYPGTNTLAYNRIQQLELAGDYNSGLVSVNPDNPPPWGVGNPRTYYSPYPYNPASNYPDGRDATGAPVRGAALRLEEAAFTNPGPGVSPTRNEPTSWWWNIRLGDKIRFSDTGRYYTVVGPCTVNPYTAAGSNAELFVNDGAPGTSSALVRQFGVGALAVTASVEFLYVVNGEDDPPLDGLVDSGFNGLDDDLTAGVDDVTFYAVGLGNPVARFGEWETERFTGIDANSPPQQSRYTILRRPVPVEGARETMLPGGVVIDATTWNMANPERSRLPIDPHTLAVDILVNGNGQVVPTTIYSSPAAFTAPFYHFWIADRTDVFDPASSGPPFLPMPQGTPSFTGSRFLKGERRLVTLFTRSGVIVTNEIEPAVLLSSGPPVIYSSGFLGINVNQPFTDAQLGNVSAR